MAIGFEEGQPEGKALDAIDMRDWPDARLYFAACDGSDRARDAIVDRYHRRLTFLARSKSRDHTKAEDAAQFAWLKYLEHVSRVRDGEAPMLENPASIRAWLMTIACNAVVAGYRQDARQRTIAERYRDELTVDDSPMQNVDDALEQERRSSAFRRALSSLNTKQQRLVDLLLVDPPMSYERIAELTGTPIGSIGPTRQRCVRRVARAIAMTTD